MSNSALSFHELSLISEALMRDSPYFGRWLETCGDSLKIGENFTLVTEDPEDYELYAGDAKHFISGFFKDNLVFTIVDTKGRMITYDTCVAIDPTEFSEATEAAKNLMEVLNV